MRLGILCSNIQNSPKMFEVFYSLTFLAANSHLRLKLITSLYPKIAASALEHLCECHIFKDVLKLNTFGQHNHLEFYLEKS